MTAHDIDVAVADGLSGIPDAEAFTRWAEAALAGEAAATVAIRLVDEDEGRALNHAYRDRDSATNVLSFAAEIPEAVAAELPQRPLGDLAICVPVVRREAAGQGKCEADHFAHLTIHGVLHLLGLDHLDDAEAEIMEARERVVLAGLGIADPYKPR